MKLNTSLNGAGWREFLQQFRGLEGRHPALWPALPRALCAVASLLAVVMVGWWFVWTAQWDELATDQQTEQRLRQEFQLKTLQAQNFEQLQQQKRDVQAQIDELGRQLPRKAEMDALLSEINQLGMNRGLQFELFKPGQVQLHEHYAELPIEIRLSGPYHALAGFVSDVANMPRIVTLDKLVISSQRDGVQNFESLVHTFRYLDPEEIALQKQQANEKKKQIRK